jgi:hypothetical protein
VRFCDQCGLDETVTDETVADETVTNETRGHQRCAARRALEPPRYCAQCRRRMVVQVLPRGWSARCVEHGVITSNG